MNRHSPGPRWGGHGKAGNAGRDVPEGKKRMTSYMSVTMQGILQLAVQQALVSLSLCSMLFLLLKGQRTKSPCSLMHSVIINPYFMCQAWEIPVE